MKLAVVIATRDRRAFLERALDSLGEQRGAPAFEAVVVDNGSSDGTAAMLAARATSAPFALRAAFVARPNRAAARNAGIAATAAEIVVFVDDDVVLPPGFLAAHAFAHAKAARSLAISGPILNVADAAARPRPTLLNYSGAYCCTCNVSIRRADLDALGGFDAGFDLYGWEDTDLGLRLRRHGVGRGFAWDAYLWHVKPPNVETLAILERKAVERGTMAARLLHRDGGLRARLATGAFAANLARSRALAPPWALGAFRAVASQRRVPNAIRAVARGQLLDGAYVTALRRATASANGRARPGE